MNKKAIEYINKLKNSEWYIKSYTIIEEMSNIFEGKDGSK